MKLLTPCLIVGCPNTSENPDTGLCASHSHELRKMERDQEKAKRKRTMQIKKHHEKVFSTASKPIPKISEKQAKALREYSPKAKKFLQDNPVCQINAPECTYVATETHHMKGRGFGYADEFARINDIPLLLDDRFWKSSCGSCHRYATDNSGFALENGHSILRTAKL